MSDVPVLDLCDVTWLADGRTILHRITRRVRRGEHWAILSLVFVVHHIEEIMPAFGRTLVLKEGRIVLQGPTPDVLRESVLQEVYGVQMRIQECKGRFWPMCR